MTISSSSPQPRQLSLPHMSYFSLFILLLALFLFLARVTEGLDSIGSMEKYGLDRNELSSEMLATVAQGIAKNDPGTEDFCLYHVFQSLDTYSYKSFRLSIGAIEPFYMIYSYI